MCQRNDVWLNHVTDKNARILVNVKLSNCVTCDVEVKWAVVFCKIIGWKCLFFFVRRFTNNDTNVLRGWISFRAKINLEMKGLMGLKFVVELLMCNSLMIFLCLLRTNLRALRLLMKMRGMLEMNLCHFFIVFFLEEVAFHQCFNFF